MTLPWLRLYTEIIDDPKTGTLSDAAFRTYIELLCLARKRGDDGETGKTSEELDWQLRRNVTVTLQELLQKQLVTVNDDETIAIPAFGERQRKSDSSAERVRKYRENKKKENGNVTVTQPSRPKSKSKKENKSKDIREKAKRFVPPSIQQVKEYCLSRNNQVDPERFIDHYTSNGWHVGKNKMKDWKASIRTWEKGNSNATRQSSNTVINHDDTGWLTGGSEGSGDGEAGEQDIQRASDSLHRLETGH